ncbi:MAG: signal peptidase II [Acidiferrobacteraceae bacterium]|nr:signal peptidase II [Acidiferrobacteraceae bacterium]
MNYRRKAQLAYVALCVLILMADISSKELVQRHLGVGSAIDVLPFIQIVLVYNWGAAFGILDQASGWQTPFFVVVGLMVAIVIIIRLSKASRRHKWSEIAFALILAGAIGNMIDRVRLGYVIDFIRLHYAGWQYPAFNIADIAIFFGASMLIFELLFGNRLRKNSF